jgi:hypothetical protein
MSLRDLQQVFACLLIERDFFLKGASSARVVLRRGLVCLVSESEPEEPTFSEVT